MADDSSEVVKEAAESVSFVNTKALGDAPAWFQNQMFAQSVSASAGWVTLNQAIVSKAAEMVMNTSANTEGADVAALGMILKALRGQPSEAGTLG
jgi:hypothetical protein